MSSAPAPALGGSRAVAPAPSAFARALPNLLTASRVAFAAAFFAILTAWAFRGDSDILASPPRVDWLMLGAGLLFIVAVATDALDGFLARRWNTESTFGRIMDPFADKVLIVGSFVFLAGPDFWWQSSAQHHFFAGPGIQVSGVYPWMVVLILARELLVTSIRGVLEARGIEFASDWWGKGKMILQSVAIPTILIILALFPVTPATSLADSSVQQMLASNPWGRTAIDAVVWLMLVTTVLSGVPYVRRGVLLMAADRGPGRRSARAADAPPGPAGPTPAPPVPGNHPPAIGP